MHPASRFATVCAIVAAAVLAASGSVAAKCQKMGFLVNDYGKEGPTKDAQDLLDKHIVKWAAEQGITKYTVSKKDVSCELFLNFVVFDEHTCTAEATVCWNEPAGSTSTKPQQAKKSTKSDESPVAAAPAKPAAKTEAPAAAKPVAPTPGPTKTAAPAVTPAKVETGTVTKPVAAKVTQEDVDNAEKAAAAAERAAAAAERAAQAAERAAQAAEDLASAAPLQKYAAPPAAAEAMPSVVPPEKEKVVAPVPPR